MTRSGRTIVLVAALLLAGLLLWRLRPGDPGSESSPDERDAAAGNASPAGTPPPLTGDDPQPPGRLFPPRPERGPAKLTGRVIDGASREPVPGVDVVFQGKGGDQTATSDSEGGYALELGPGSYEVRAVGADVLSAPGPALRVRGGEVIELDVEVQRQAVLSGVVVDSAERGVGGAEVVLSPVTRLQRTQVTFGDLPASTTTDNAGRFTLEVMAAASVFLEATSGDRWGVARVDAIAPGSTRDGVVISLAGGATVAGVVVAPDQTPVADAAIFLQTRDGSFARGRDAQSDSRGRFHLDDVMAGIAWIEARKPGFAASAPMRLELAPAKRRDLRLVLQAPLPLAGKVVGPSGEPVKRARVRAGRGGSRMPPLETYTDDDGRFRFETADGGPYWVGAYEPSFAIGEVKRIAPPVTDLLLKLRHFGGISGRVADGAGQPVRSFEVAVVEHTRVGQDKPRRLDQRTYHADAGGEFRIYPLEPGTYRLEVAASGAGKAELGEVEVEGNKVTSVSAVLR